MEGELGKRLTPDTWLIQSISLATIRHSFQFATSYFYCRYFSYEHFYVIYCKFWELDTDHDFLIDKENLIRYGNHALTYRIVDRIFSQVCFVFLSLFSLVIIEVVFFFL